MKKALLFPFLFLCNCAYSQPFNTPHTSLVQVKPIYFNYGNVDEMLQSKTIYNAIELKVKDKCNVYASVNMEASGLVNGKISIKESSGNTEHLLTGTPTLIKSETAPPGNATNTYYYDVIMKPFTKFTVPNNYSFSLTFTMTKQ